MTGAEVLTKFTADTSGVDKATNGFTVGLGKLTQAFTLANVATNAINKTIAIFNQNLDSAISRYDTMNNFPKVMSNLGIGAEESSEVIADLSEKLTGLPTALDEGARAVQRFTAKNGNIKESEKIFLAVNNAILAGGANAQIQASALEQLTQAYSKSKMDMMEWKTLQMAIPAQLNQIAKAMGTTTDALGDNMRTGAYTKETMDEFIATMIKLNETGIEGFASFEEQARGSTQGVSTSIANMKTAIVRGITNVITGVNEGFKEFGGLSGVISKIGKIAEKVFKKMGSVISKVIPFLIQIGENIMPQLEAMFIQIAPVMSKIFEQIMPTAISVIKELLPMIVQIITTILPVIVELINMLLPPLLEIIKMILPVIQSLLNSLLPLIKPIVSLIKPIIEVLMAVIKPLVEIISTILPPLIDLFSTITNVILPPLTAAFDIMAGVVSASIERMFNFIKPIFDNIKKYLGGVIDFIGGVFSGDWSRVWQGVKDIFSSIVSTLIEIFKTPLNWIIDGINVFIRGLNKIQIPDWVPGVGGKGLNISEIPRLNVGTNYVPEDTLAVLHKGEAVVPKKFNPYSSGVDSQLIGRMNAIAPTVNVIVNAQFETDPLGQMVQNIKTFSGGAKNDYNYGMGR